MSARAPVEQGLGWLYDQVSGEEDKSQNFTEIATNDFLTGLVARELG